MTEYECITNFRIMPEIYAFEIAKYFAGEMIEGLSTQWGVLFGRSGQCLHWVCTVECGNKVYTPALCFTDRKEAEIYCDAMSVHFPRAVKALTGQSTHQFSQN